MSRDIGSSTEVPEEQLLSGGHRQPQGAQAAAGAHPQGAHPQGAGQSLLGEDTWTRGAPRALKGLGGLPSRGARARAAGARAVHRRPGGGPQITETRGPAASMRRDALFRRALLMADVVAVTGAFVLTVGPVRALTTADVGMQRRRCRSCWCARSCSACTTATKRCCARRRWMRLRSCCMWRRCARWWRGWRAECW